MQKSYRKNIQRDFRSNLNRFLSLFGIVALGVMMLTGLVSFAPSMRTAGQKYYVQQNVFDLRVLSTLGLSESRSLRHCRHGGRERRDAREVSGHPRAAGQALLTEPCCGCSSFPPTRLRIPRPI